MKVIVASGKDLNNLNAILREQQLYRNNYRVGIKIIQKGIKL